MRRSRDTSESGASVASESTLRSGSEDMGASVDRLLGRPRYIKHFRRQHSQPSRFSGFSQRGAKRPARRKSTLGGALPASLLPTARAIPLWQLLAVGADAQHHAPRVLHANQRITRGRLRGEGAAIHTALTSALFSFRHVLTRRACHDSAVLTLPKCLHRRAARFGQSAKV